MLRNHLHRMTFGMLIVLSGCAGPSLLIPKIAFEPCDWPKPPDPVFVGIGGAGPLFSEPHVMHGPNCCGSCNGCCAPSRPVQPIDPFGWLKQGSQGTQVVDPIGWVTGI